MYLKTHILLHFILICGIKTCLGENNELEDICDCNCDLEIDVVKHFNTQLESLQQLVKQIPAQILKLQTEQKRPSRPTNCMEAAAGTRKSGIYTIKSQLFGDEPFKVWCDEDTDFGGWIVIQRRLSAEVDFYRDWQQYKQGFGELSGNYWIGLNKLHALTASFEQELYIKMERLDGTKYYAKYDLFVIGSEEEDYVLRTLGNYTGNAGDSLKYHEGSKFTTFDRDNDANPAGNCAEFFRGAWWYKECYSAI
ncbi:PREDICTED: fibrinogen C domain-containing protein 1-like isoform X3 [Rhagoletis zephyria]|uniref:fibrinogen C domain-containing protein 1-like isoform X2 n=1 Tax=Rhagoletis zephyria TaxID=28612 RepID=UPI0008117F0C|nr:PREDICTED: fibrinogen C domain-containing protein 1-like isoform X2 [Rhagoletis zephyria]XP_017465767.1 PREDICTED: fibrinogen C domain-containing protein 1-like isoform X3 [Rhagoletis zephyria]